MFRSLNIFIFKFIFFLFCFTLLTFNFSLLTYGACTPPSDYSTCPAEIQPDINLTIRGWEATNGSKNLFYYQHPTDLAPELNTLIERNGNPAVTSLYKIKPMPWDPPDFLNPPSGLSEFATLVGFKTNIGQNILVPKYYNTIDGINQVTILYATSNQITINYTIDDSPSNGYLIHLLNLNVNQDLINCYNKYNSEGRKELPVMAAGEIIGQASGNEVLVSIRDRGSFMDPRWENDWWVSKTPASSRPYSCKSLSVINIPQINGRNYNPNRLLETSDTTESLSDTVLLKQVANLAPGDSGTRVVTRGGWFQEFQDLKMPFAEELTKYLAGPFVRDIGNNSNLKIKQFQNNIKIEEAGALSKLTTDEFQDELRHVYRWKCGNSYGDPNGYYCSSVTIGVAPDCPDSSSNECLFSDGTEFQNGPRKPHYKDAVFQTNGQFDSIKYQKALDLWNSNSKNVQKWHEIPLVSNPNTFVEQAVFMNACPYPASSNRNETTVNTKTPWVSALKDVSTILNSLLVPKGAGSTGSLPSPLSLNSPSNPSSKTLLASKDTTSNLTNKTNETNSPILLAQNTPNENSCALKIVMGSSGFEAFPNAGEGCGWRDIITWYYHCDDRVFPGPFMGRIDSQIPLRISCPENTKNIIIDIQSAERDGCDNTPKFPKCSCAVLKDSTGKITTNCGNTILPPQPTPTCAPPRGLSGRSDINASEVDTNKIDHALLREPATTLHCNKWEGNACVDGTDDVNINDPVWAVVKYPFLNTIYENLSGENGIFRIFQPTENITQNWDQEGESKITYCFAKFEKTSSMIDGTLQIDKTLFTKPPAKCDNNTYTKGISVYPKFIGGVQNAKEWIINCILKPNSKCKQ